MFIILSFPVRNMVNLSSYGFFYLWLLLQYYSISIFIICYINQCFILFVTMVRKVSHCVPLGLFGIHGNFWVLCICPRYFMVCYHFVLH